MVRLQFALENMMVAKEGKNSAFFHTIWNLDLWGTRAYSKASNYRTTTIEQIQGKTSFHMADKEGQSNVVEQISNIQFKTISINLNAQHVNGRTHFNLPEHVGKCTVIRCRRVRMTPPKI